METTPPDKEKKGRTLIPLTSEIEIAMMDFRDSNSSTDYESSISLTDLVKKEVESCLRAFDASIECCIKKEELSEIINQCLQEKLPQYLAGATNQVVCNPSQSTATTADRDMEVTIQFVDNDSNSEQSGLKENFSILEQRISMLESRISSVFQMIPRLKKISGKFKIDRKTLQQSIEKYLQSAKSSRTAIENIKKEEEPKHVPSRNLYDDMYYEWRQNKMNLTRYKKSETTMQLNKRLEMEHFHGPPIKNQLPTSNVRVKKPFKPRFIESKELINNIKSKLGQSF